MEGKQVFVAGFSAYGEMLLFFLTDLTLTDSEFHRVGAAIEKALVPTFVLTLGTKSRL